tara:strand:+ start:366 stop:545 length:180 start_codon:yes stop_codon:yes gene_type:complete
MREIDFRIIETLEDLMDAMLEKAEKSTQEKKKSRMPDSIIINISNDKYGHHGNGKDEQL